MTRKALAVVLALAAIKAHASDFFFVTGNQLLQRCSAPETQLDPTDCLGYITGITDAFSSAELGICIQKGVTRGQIAQVVQKYLEEHPEELHYAAASVAWEGLKRAFPCP